MWRVRDCKASMSKYRCYSPTSMTAAYMKVKDTGASIRGTAREYMVPEASLRHKLSGRVNPEAVRSGPQPVFSQEEEAMLVEHLKFTASVGYGYSRREVVDMATEFAISLGHREKGQTLSIGWFVHLKSRWPELKALAPRGLEIQRAKATSKDCVDKYYNELQRILTKYHLEKKPERIYNVDEKGLSTRHKPPPVIAASGSKPPVVVSASRTNVTVLGCGNAQGQQIPPFFVFPGTRMNQVLLEGGIPCVDGDVSESGWSNGEIFRKYLQNHLLKFLPERSSSCPVLLFYDGHRSHVNLGLVEWARKQNIILFVLPAHTSHVLQPMDVACFGPFERIFNNISHRFMRENCDRSITKFDICKLGSSAYLKALSPENLQSSFKKAGIYPFNPNAVDPSNFLTSTTLEQEKPSNEDSPTQASTFAVLTPSNNTPSVSSFFTAKEKPLTDKKPATKKRKYLSYEISGKAITEDNMVEVIREHEQKKKLPSKSKAKPRKSATASTSGTVKAKPVKTHTEYTFSSDDDEIEDNEKCCVCGKFTPDEVRQSTSLIFVKWVKCDKCEHWTHLRFCTKTAVIRRGDKVCCIHCTSVVGSEE